MSNPHQDLKVIVGIFLLSSLNKTSKNKTKITRIRLIPITTEREYSARNLKVKNLSIRRKFSTSKSIKFLACVIYSPNTLFIKLN